jgi:hypothetical protein
MSGERLTLASKYMQVNTGERANRPEGRPSNQETTQDGAMVEITCDSCGKKKPEEPRDDGWVLGYDLEVQTPNALNHSIRFLDRWDDRRILELGAVHFCSVKCRDAFLKRSRAA